MAKKSSSADYKEIMSEIKRGNFSPVYLLMGEEDYYIDKLAEALEETVVSEEEKDFNANIIYGADTDVNQVISLAQQYPVMADRQLVMLKESQTMYRAKTNLEKFASYVNHPNPTTVLVVIYKGDSLSSTSDFVKSVNKINGVVLKSERIKDYLLPTKVGEYCREKKVKIDDKTISLLCEYIGSPLSKLFGEIDKLIVASGDSRTITPELVESIIGISREFNSFELIKSISVRNFATSMKIVDYFSKNPKENPGVVVTATLFNYFSKLFIASISKDKTDAGLMKELDLKSSYSLGDYKNGIRNFSPASIDGIIHAIRQLDAESKGIGSSKNEYDLLKELIFKIFTIK
ncbi:MAG: DNA polymerase III subunit delta [Muribaculaceae bacterium]|nr:DNA polymerase III subunit delta [Muribaculaceae bacterium]